MMTGNPKPKPKVAAASPTPAPAAIPKAASSPELPEVDSEADYASAWKEFDPSLKSSITAAQFRQVMAALGENVSDAEVEELMNSVDGEGKISCKSFPAFCDSRKQSEC